MTNWPLPRAPIYLWTLPMFHANGWCFTWAITAAAGTHVCLRKVNAANILSAIQKHGVDHFCAAPIVLAGIASMPAVGTAAVAASRARSLPPARRRPLRCSRPSAQWASTSITYLELPRSPARRLAVHGDEWDTLPPEQQGKLKARQGVRAAAFERMSVADLATLEPVPAG